MNSTSSLGAYIPFISRLIKLWASLEINVSGVKLSSNFVSDTNNFIYVGSNISLYNEFN